MIDLKGVRLLRGRDVKEGEEEVFGGGEEGKDGRI